ncbi:aminotransferase class I/II-fold pyridoxal phosphate-dependent enzyme [Hydrogenophaga sp. A37]|uniref:aminotransferase class I/II-fold pyridoxal phosphate-dependent enzyme n=1 Tax=Hydrogenophaga sp. A37 TaxID=1945864 RepID=UPI000984FC92|nr:8-amino-7-oxononanoate synthase [Hydrogenophaga sp. A37]
MAMSWLNEFDERLAALDAQSLRRVRRAVTPEPGARLNVDGESLLAFCSNDYLGLAQDPLLRQAVHAAVDRYGVGSGASPMVSGHSVANAALERELAEAVGLPRALYFYAGYATNASTVPALVGEGDALFSDALNHACLIDGARLSKATVHRFSHGDLARLDALLAASPARRKLVISDAVFSMDGDVADIAGLHALCERHDALLLLDDAHGFGVLGPQGRGALAAAGLTGAGASPRVLYMATLGKALGVAGAFVAGPERLVEWLLQKTRSYTYATAAPALLAEAVRAGLRCALGAEGERRRQHLNALIAQLREGLAPGADAAVDAAGWTLMASSTAIQPLVIGDNGAALAVMAALREQGIWVPAIRPPTVPVGTARLRIALSAAHQSEDVAALVDALRAAAAGLGAGRADGPGQHRAAAAALEA